jgi:DNA repair exonuclease SbcCD ATPase subunit
MESAITDKTELRLLSLKLSNFKGIKKYEVHPNGKSLNIYGANETGKTTLADAVTYLLFDRDTLGSTPTNFGIKTRVDGEELHGVDHEVVGEFSNFTLKKVFHEVWTRSHGEAEATFDRHTTDYYIDEVMVKKKDYQAKVEQIMSEDVFKMLTLPDYFPETMHWTDRRSILTDMAGDISPEDIIQRNEGLEEYLGILDGKSEDDRKNILQSKRKNANDQLKNIPSRIDENERQIEEVEGVEEAEKAVAELKEKKEKIESKKSEVKSGGAVAEMKVEISEIEAKKSQLVNQLNERNDVLLSGLREKLESLNDRKDEAQSVYNKCVTAYKEADRKVAEAESEVNRIEMQIDKRRGEEPEPKPEDKDEICPMCERPLEKDEQEGNDHYEEYVKKFNSQKALDIKALKDELGDATETLNNAKADLKEKEKEGAKAKSTLNQVSEQVEKVEAELTEKKKDMPDPKDSDSYKELVSKQDDLRDKIKNYEDEKASQVEALDKKIRELEQEISDANRVILKQEQNQKILARIEELKEERKKVGEELEDAEHQLYVIDQFIRARSKVINERLPDFGNVEFRFFKEQINGGLDEGCEVIYKGVPFSEGLNNAGRIQAGLEIIRVLTKYYGKSAPILIDNRESVTELPDMGDLQVISLIVSPEDKELRVEKVKSKMAVA